MVLSISSCAYWPCGYHFLWGGLFIGLPTSFLQIFFKCDMWYEFFVEYMYLKYFFPLCGLHFHCLNDISWWTEFLSLNGIQFFNFFLILQYIFVLLRRFCLLQGCETIVLFFFFKRCIILFFMFVHIVYLQLIFVYGVSYDSSFTFSLYGYPINLTSFFEKTTFSLLHFDVIFVKLSECGHRVCFYIPFRYSVFLWSHLYHTVNYCSLIMPCYGNF